jgi:hypothetical protein
MEWAYQPFVALRRQKTGQERKGDNGDALQWLMMSVEATVFAVLPLCSCLGQLHLHGHPLLAGQRSTTGAGQRKYKSS